MAALCGFCRKDSCNCQAIMASCAKREAALKKRWAAAAPGTVATHHLLATLNEMSKLTHPSVHVTGWPDGETRLDQIRPKEELVFESVSLWAITAYFRAGQNTFILEESLAEALIHTDLKSTRGEDIQLPYAAFRIELPLSCIALYCVGTGWHAIDALMVAEGMREGKRSLLVYLMGRTNVHSKDAHDDYGFYCAVPLENELALPETSDTWALPADKIKLSEEHMKSLGGYRVLGEDLMRDEFTQKVASFVLNTLLYLTLDERDVEQRNGEKIAKLTAKRNKRKTDKRRLENLRKAPVYLVGGKTKQRNALHTGEGQSFSHAFLVRGHWRNQPYGPRSALRKQLWIRPHLKGTGATLEGTREYRVREQKS